MYDTFWFEMAERPGDLLDITIRRADDETFTKSEVRTAVNRLHHNIVEETMGSKLYCVIEIYENSITSVRYRGEDEPKLTGLRDYIWMRRRVEEAIHGDFSSYPILPRWMIDTFTLLMFLAARVMQVVDAVFDLRRDEAYRRTQETLGELDEEEMPEQGEQITVPREAEIIPFPMHRDD